VEDAQTGDETEDKPRVCELLLDDPERTMAGGTLDSKPASPGNVGEG
jgi:hypothetical protein